MLASARSRFVSARSKSVRLIDGIPVFGKDVDPGALAQIQTTLRCGAERVALMADHHKGYAVPIGGVVAYEDKVSPSGVGFDIGCGNKAVLTDADAAEVRTKIGTIMDDVWRTISFGVGRRNEEKVDHALFDSDAWKLRAVAPLKEMARQQLGTVGSGNHYVDIFVDERDRVWIGVHFGSRGLGHKTATHFLKAAGAADGMDVAPCVIDANTDLGADYIVAMRLAGEYAYAGRDWVCGRVDGRRLGDCGGPRESARRRDDVLDDPWRGPRDGPHGSQGEGRSEDRGSEASGKGDAGNDAGVGEARGRGVARRRPGRIAALLQASAGRVGRARRDDRGVAHTHAPWCRDGGGKRV